jgi:dihydroxyacetone kinase DhaKLM complex PTS-EIIA-like component DhaM
MAYIGREPSYGSFEKQALTADSSATSFALNYVVGSSASILVSVAGVIQEPEVAYNISGGGANIVFTAAPTTGDTVFVVFLGVAQDVGTLGTGAITSQTSLGEAPQSDDVLLLYDTSATSLKKVTIANLFDTQMTAAKYITRTLTGNGSTTTMTVTNGHNVDSVIVTENGIVQRPTTDYTVSGTTLTFTTAPASGVAVRVKELLI